MAIELTPEELKGARKQVDELQKRALRGRHAFFPVVILLPFVLGVGGACVFFAVRILDMVRSSELTAAGATSSHPALAASTMPSPDWHSNMIAAVVLMCSAGGAMLLFGLLLLVDAYEAWNKHHFYSIAAKLLQEKLDELQKETP